MEHHHRRRLSLDCSSNHVVFYIHDDGGDGGGFVYDLYRNAPILPCFSVTPGHDNMCGVAATKVDKRVTYASLWLIIEISWKLSSSFAIQTCFLIAIKCGNAVWLREMGH